MPRADHVLQLVLGLPPRGQHLAAVRQACSAKGAVLSFDGTQTGYGATGSFWMHQQQGVVPDAVTLGKGLGAGSPRRAQGMETQP